MQLRRWSFERKHVLGGVVFGVGWAITGACPGTAATTVGGGSVMGLVLVGGIIGGIALRDVVVARQEMLATGPAEERAVS